MDSVLGKLIFGNSLPKVPAAPHVDIDKETTASINAASSDLPSLEKLSSKINAFAADQFNKNREVTDPGSAALRAKELGVINGALDGNIAGYDEWAKRTGAEMGVGQGTAGSAFNANSTLYKGSNDRMKIISSGFDWANRWLSQGANIPQFNFGNFMLSAQQRIADVQWNEQQRFGPEWMQAQIDAVPPAWQQAVDQVANWAEKSAASYANMSMGGMGGGSSTQGSWNSGNSNGFGSAVAPRNANTEADYNQAENSIFSMFGTGGSGM